MERRIEIEVLHEDAGRTIEKLLTERLGLTRKQVSQAKFRSGGICVNGVRQRVNCRVHENDRLQVLLEEESTSSAHLVPLDVPPDILYEDQDLLVADKPAGLVVHPSPGHYGDSLANMLVSYFENKGSHVMIRPVGRLDRETSGIMVFAKNQAAASRLERQKAEGIYKKEYLALASGCPEKKSGEIRQPVRRIPGELMKMEVSPFGKDAWTEYEILEEYRIEKEHMRAAASLVRLELHTGRTHQIRVHMAYMGHPLLGDTLYRTDSLQRGSAGGGAAGFIRRAALHASGVTLIQPFTKERLCFNAPFPEDMKRCVDSFLCRTI